MVLNYNSDDNCLWVYNPDQADSNSDGEGDVCDDDRDDDCNDGNACTTDSYADNTCAYTPVVCNDNNICTDDSCNPSTGCAFANNTATCDDGNACTENDVCANGECTSGTARNCDDGKDETMNSCDPERGCVFDPITLTAGDDLYGAIYGKSLTVPAGSGVLSNDGTGGSTALTAALVSGPSSGTLNLKPDGSFTYRPMTRFIGTDTFTYQAMSGSSPLNEGIVTIIVAKCPWLLKNELYIAKCGEDKVVLAGRGVLANDVGATSVMDPELITIDPAYGSIEVEEDGSFVYHAAKDIHTGTYVLFRYNANNGVCDATYQGIAKIQVSCAC